MTVEQARAAVAAAQKVLDGIRLQRAAIEAELSSLASQAKGLSLDDSKAFARLSTDKASAEARLEAVQDREADAADEVKAAQGHLSRAEAAERLERAQESRREVLQDGVEVTEWLRDVIGPQLRARIEKHKALVREGAEAARAVGWDAPSTVWSRAPTDSEVWEGAGERIRAAAQAEADRQDRLRRDKVMADYWAREAARPQGFALGTRVRAVPVVDTDSDQIRTEYNPFAKENT